MGGTRKPPISPVLLGIAFLSFNAPLEAGLVSGEAKFVGTRADPKRLEVAKDQDHCGATVPDESLLIGSRGGLKNVVVFLDMPGTHALSTGKEHILSSEGCRFVPRVTSMALGEKLLVRNNDPKLHIVHAYLENRTVFNIAAPFPGQRLEITHKIKKPGLLQVNCDTHSWMRGYVYVFTHPFFAVTDDIGLFSVPNVPPGNYTLKAWHEKGGVRSMEIRVPEEGKIKVNFDFGR